MPDTALSPPRDDSPHLAPPRYLTEDLPPVGGRIKERPEDFLVEEIPAYEPSGRGEHIYMLIEKRGMSTFHLVRLLATHFGLDTRAIGYAGLKDKHAVTRQVISVHVPGKKIEDFPSLRHERLTVLWADYHDNKLRTGHLKGNRFSIRIRGVEAPRALAAKRALDRLARLGVPNRIGEQRFGNLENNHRIGRALILRDNAAVIRELLGPSAERPDIFPEARRLFAEGRPAEALEALPGGARTERRVLKALVRGDSPSTAVGRIEEVERAFYVAAFQSAVFNAVLDERLLAGTLASLEPGDVAFKHENGSLFDVTEETLDDPGTAARLERIEISPSGPMWGVSMKRAAGRVDEREAAALARTGVGPEAIAALADRPKLHAEGARRPLRVPLIDPDVEGGGDEHGGYVRCAFELPRGAFATAVLREIMKPERCGGDHARPFGADPE